LKWLRRGAWALAVLLIVWGVSWLAVPPLLQSQVEHRLSERLGRRVTIGAVDFEPWSLELTLRELTIAGRGPGMAPLLRVNRIHANADWRSVLRLAPVIEALEVDAPRLNLARTADGRYDIDDVIARFQSRAGVPSPTSEPARFALYNVQLRGGAIVFDDRPVKRRHEMTGMLLTLPFLSDLPADIGVKVEPRLAFTLDGTRFDTGAQSTPFARSRDTSLTLRTGELDLAVAKPYVPRDVPVDLQRGKVTVDLALHFALRPDGSPVLSLRGSAGASDVALVDRAGAPLAAWKSLQVALADVQPLERTVALGAVRVDGLDVAVTRDAQGRINLLQLAAGTPPDPKPGRAWQVGMQSLELSDARVSWIDAATAPATTWRIDGIASRIGPVAWPSAAPAPLTLQGRLHGPGLEGRASFAGAWVWVAEPAAFTVNIERASVDELRVADTTKKARDPLGWKKLEIADTQVDVTGRRVAIGRVTLEQPQVVVTRSRDRRIHVGDWQSPPSSPAAPASRPWQVKLGQAAISEGRIRWRDEAPNATRSPVPVRLDVSALRVVVEGLGLPAGAPPAQVQVSAVVADPAAPRGSRRKQGGTVTWRGQVSADPLLLRGALGIDRFPLHAVEPYFGGGFNVSMQRAEAQWRGDVSLRQRPDGIEAHAAGDALLADLHVFGIDPVTGARSPEELLSWQSFRLSGLKLAMAPKARPRIEVGEAVVSDFYSQLVVTEQGRFNLRDVRAPEGAASSPPGGFAVGPQIAASAPASASVQPPSTELPVDIRVGGLQLVNGRVDYTDRFVRPNYSAALSELNGRLGAFATGTREMAALELRGRVAGTAQLDIRGSLNPMADPLALDVGARATDLELAPLSPYAGKYAGYAIERGKLSMDVHYVVQPDGRLEASNHLVLNQLTFGDRIESPDATKLPVRLAVALLKDRHGVIDVNLPVSGSLNDPQFSVAGIIVKVVVNLIAKALTAPFSLLFGGSGGEDLGQVAFRPGTSAMADGAPAVIDKVAKALEERASLQVTVTGAADPVGEAEAIRQALLDRRIAMERRNESLHAGIAASAPGAIPPDERARLVRTIYRDADLPDKPRNVLGFAKDIPVVEMETLLKKHLVVDGEAARELALQRGVTVRDALVAKGLPADRLFLAAPKVRAAGDETGDWSPRAQLALSLR